MWFVWLRDWLHHQADRLAYYWLTRPMERAEEYVREWQAENARRDDLP